MQLLSIEFEDIWRWRLTQTFGYNAALGAWIDDPIVIFESVYRLENGANTSHIAIDLCVAEKFGGQIGIKTGLDIGWRIDPQGRIEEHVIEQLPREKWETEQLQGISRVTYAVLK